MALEIVKRKRGRPRKDPDQPPPSPPVRAPRVHRVNPDQPDFTLPAIPASADQLPDHPIRVQRPVYTDDEQPDNLLTFEIEQIPYFEALPIEELKFALAKSDTPKATHFLKDLCDVNLRHLGITVLAARNGFRFSELLDVWRNHKLVASLGVIMDGAPSVAADTLIDAQSVTICCPRCDGAGVMRILKEEGYSWIDCKTCRGSGEVRRPGDPKSREYVFKASGMIKPDSGVQIFNVNNSASADSVIDELERLPAINVSVEE